MRKALLVLVVLAMAAGVMFGVSGQAAAADKKFTFGFTSMQLSNPFFTYIEQTIRNEVEANGDVLITTDPAMDREKQINQIEDLISQKIDAIFLNPVDWEAIRPALVALNRAGIPIINFDAEVKDLDMVTAYAGSNNWNAGHVCGLDLVKRFPDGGPIAILDAPMANSARDRIDGFMEAIEGKNFTVVYQKDSQGDLPLALRNTEDMLQSNPEVIAIMGANDPTGLGAMAALITANRTDIVIYGVDGSPEAKAAIAADGPFVGSGAQSPVAIARESVKLAYKILNDEPFDFRIPVETFMINEDNVHEFGTEGWQ